MKIVLLILTTLLLPLVAKDIVLKNEGKYRILSNVHLVNEVPYKKTAIYQALIEISTGVTEKWEVNHKNGYLEWEFKNGKPREVKFLGYPGNYGFIPQTILEKKDGGDGDPLDIIVLGTAVSKGTIQEVKILGAIKLLDQSEHDDKIIAIPLNGVFKNVNSLAEMMMKFPGSIQIIRYWFEGYKGKKIQFIGYLSSKEAKILIEKAHKSWSKHTNER